MMRPTFILSLFGVVSAAGSTSKINRQKIVQSFNPQRNASSPETPLQVGNGNFAFGVDITGLQTFSPFATMSTWGWHNFSLPTTPGQTIEEYNGTEWWTHGRLVEYNMPSPDSEEIGEWLRENPHRINLGRVGLSFGGDANVTEASLESKQQELDLWSGAITSTFTYKGSKVKIETRADPRSDTVAVNVDSELLISGDLAVFFDFPYPVNEKFNNPFVGVYNETEKHATSLETHSNRATIHHDLNTTEYDMTVEWQGKAHMKSPSDGSHRYTLSFQDSNSVQIVVNWAPIRQKKVPRYRDITRASRCWWASYWNKAAFVDMASVGSTDAKELQRRTILSQYLLAVNSASDFSPQESGLVNNGWYGKFHMEMILWHLVHFARWGHWDLLHRALPNAWTHFLPAAFDRAHVQGYEGARWGKMTDPSTIDAPGEINALLIWQQPHPMYFAELEYREFPTEETLSRWADVIDASADFMASFAYYNQSTGVYDLGPPMYTSSENTNPNVTLNPPFELAYWRFGLDVASEWRTRMGLEIPAEWTHVKDNLAPIPIDQASRTYPVYEGIPDMWIDPETFFDHPSMVAIYGVLPPPWSGEPLNQTVLDNTASRIWEQWSLDESFGWDFPMLAMNSLRLGDHDRALQYLLHSSFQFDDAGYAIGGTRVPTPYFPSSGGLLMAVSMMAAGWDGNEGPHFPEGWNVEVEGMVPSM